jgi:hypothetical protein
MIKETRETTGARLFKFFSVNQGDPVLIRLGMEKEFKWMSEECPSIAGLLHLGSMYKSLSRTATRAWPPNPTYSTTGI